VGPIDDHDLVKASQSGDEQAMTQLIAVHAGPVHGFILSLIGDRTIVEDIAQETFLRAFLSIKKYEHRAPFRSWLFRIALNLCRDHLRKRKVRTIVSSFQQNIHKEEETEFPDPQPDVLQQVVQKEQRQALYAALQQLPESLRKVIVLRDLQEYSYEEIAQLLQWRMGTVKSRLFRARKALADLLKSYYEDGHENDS